MSIYLSTFASGFEELVEQLLKKDIHPIQNIKMMDGAVVYETPVDLSLIQEIKYFNNSFIVLKSFNYNATPETSILEKMAEEITKDKKIAFPAFPKFKIFKIFTSLENQLVSIDGKTMYKLVDSLKSKTRKEYNAIRADAEFWLLYRSEKIGFFMLRVTKNKKKTAKGELRPEITNLLCKLSNPKETDNFLDPFCGSGAIPLERSRICGYDKIFAMDINKERTSELKNTIKNIKNSKLQKYFFVKNGNFLENSFQDGFFDSITTDPPWGLFEEIDDNFYPKMMQEFARIIKPSGKLVILTAQKSLIQENTSGFKLKKQYDILLSGQKAAVFLLEKL